MRHGRQKKGDKRQKTQEGRQETGERGKWENENEIREMGEGKGKKVDG